MASKTEITEEEIKELVGKKITLNRIPLCMLGINNFFILYDCEFRKKI